MSYECLFFQWLFSSSPFVISSQFVKKISRIEYLFTGGIKFELAEIESRNEEYPFVSSFLRLICQVNKYFLSPSQFVFHVFFIL